MGSGVTALDLYSKGRPLSGGVDKTVRLWKVERDTHLMFNKHTYAVDAVCVVDQDRFVSDSQDGSIMLWSQTSKKPLASTSLGSTPRRSGCGQSSSGTDEHWVSALGTVRRGDIVFSGSSAGKLQGWRLAKAEGGTDKKGVEFVPALDSIQLPGCINQIAVGKRIVACAVGKELKSGRWIYERSMRNGVVIMPLSYSEG